MSSQTKRIYFDADEATQMKLQSFVGKSYMQAKDYQVIIQSLINKAYEKFKGKKIQ